MDIERWLSFLEVRNVCADIPFQRRYRFAPVQPAYMGGPILPTSPASGASMVEVCSCVCVEAWQARKALPQIRLPEAQLYQKSIDKRSNHIPAPASR